MLANLYNALIQIIGNPNTLNSSIANMPVTIQVAHMMMYVVSSLIVLMVVSFVFKFLLKLVER